MSQWTKEQLDAVTARGTGVIVSAAAGSGKTSVLVERLLGILSDTENKMPADRLVVVTFTNDAAEQMKQRLSAALSEKIAREPDNLWLCRQQSLLRTAKISTIHSFCFDLIRENIQSLDVSAGFRILDDAEETLLKRRAAENVFEKLYGETPEETERLAGFFSGSRRGDEELEETVLKLYEFLTSIPFYEDWLKNAADRYKKGFDPNTDPLAKLYLNRLEEVYRRLAGQAEYAGKLYFKLCGKASDAIEVETDRIKLMLKNLSRTEYGWDERVVQPPAPKTRISFPRSMTDAEKETAERIKDIRNRYKKELDKTGGGVFRLEEIADDYRVHGEILESLNGVIMLFAAELDKLKTEKNALGFSDAEQLAIRLLAEKDGDGNIVATRLARELSDYYGMIMIDEFQDANDNQDLIFKLLSKGGTAEKGGTNLFAVGDVKQSIYSFRQANPKLFTNALAVAESYTGADFSGTNAAIFLNRNFRSSEEVVGFVNYVFGCVMSKAAGGIDYTEAEALVRGLDYPEGDRTTEIITVPDCENDENAEARAVAARIKRMLGTETVFDKGTVRPCRPGDFCILLRNNKNAERYVAELAGAGIKAYAEEPAGYLQSREISALTSLLAVIDNPMQNIPLAAALMSPMFMLTADDMARLAEVKGGNEERYFRAIKRVLEGGTDIGADEPLYGKLEKFMSLFGKLRYCAASQTLERFIRTIYDSTDFLSAVQVYKDGSQKRANLRLLLDVAESYEKNSGGGLSGFVRYINMIIRRGGDLKRASAVSQAEDTVSVKTIHRSKGLEYPFVFLCGSSGHFNEEDLKRRIQINSEYGIGFGIQDRERLRLYNSFPQEVLKELNRGNAKSEEMRLLYVALTRARERLFITVPDSKKVRGEIASMRSEVITGGGVTPSAAAGARSMLDWISLAMLVHPDGEWFRDGEFVPLKETETAVRVCKADTDGENVPETEDAETVLPDEDKVKRLLDGFAFVYDGELTDKSAKVTVTEISKSADGDRLFLRRPEFAEAGGLTAAEKGTAVHTFMQYADFSAAEADPAAEAERLAERGLLTPEESGSLNIGQIKVFFASELYGRIKKSDSIRREQKFLIKKSDAALDDERLMEYNDNSMLQGIADCMFEEDGEIVLIDYKTDRGAGEKTLADRYDLQIKLYAAALGRIFGKRVKEAYLYSFALGRAVRVL
ncbi:MAG: helicase-exonuclease AddAB subunit AddA [Prevotella sp.]|nr:helicase-exonuclease AddAB subunit AddA [Prevotella sp.]